MASSEFVVDQHWTSNTSGPLRWIWSHIRRNPLLIAAIFVGGAGNAGLAAALPVLIGIGFDAVVGDGEPNLRLLLIVALIMVGSQLLRSVLQLGRNFGSEVLGQRLERDARQELYASLLGKNMGFHDLHATGDLMARATNDVRELALMMAPGFNLVIGSLNFLIIPLIIAPTIHPDLLWTPAGFALTYLFAMYLYLRELSPVTANVRRSFGLLNAGLTESIEGIETVKGAAQEENEVGRFPEKCAPLSQRLRGAGARRGALFAAAAAGHCAGHGLLARALTLPNAHHLHRRCRLLHGTDSALWFSRLRLDFCLFAGLVRRFQRAPHFGADPQRNTARRQRSGRAGDHSRRRSLRRRHLLL